MSPPRRGTPPVAPPPRIPLTGDAKTDVAVRQITEDATPAVTSELAQARKIAGVTFSVGTVTVVHGLGRQLTGWMITRPIGAPIAAGVYEGQPTDDKRLTLVSAASGRADVWVW